MRLFELFDTRMRYARYICTGSSCRASPCVYGYVLFIYELRNELHTLHYYVLYLGAFWRGALQRAPTDTDESLDDVPRAGDRPRHGSRELAVWVQLRRSLVHQQRLGCRVEDGFAFALGLRTTSASASDAAGPSRRQLQREHGSCAFHWALARAGEDESSVVYAVGYAGQCELPEGSARLAEQRPLQTVALRLLARTA